MKNNKAYEAIVNKIWNMYYTDEKSVEQIVKIVCGVNESEVKKMLGIKEVKKA